MMDKGDEVPVGRCMKITERLNRTNRLRCWKTWHGKANGRIRYCFAPRFAVSCTRELLEQVGRLARERGVMIHTHASENRTECAIVEAETGLRNVAYLNQVGLTGSHVALAHCVHLSEDEMETLLQTEDQRRSLSVVESETRIGYSAGY